MNTHAIPRHKVINRSITRDEIRDPDFTIFIVEDSKSSRMMLERYLTKMPNSRIDRNKKVTIHAFASGEEAIESMDLNPNILIVDHYLDEEEGQLNGLHVIREFKKSVPSILPIVMSGQQNVLLATEYFHSGAFDYISKEHACHQRIEQSVVKAMIHIENERKKKRREYWIKVGVFMLGAACAWMLK